jgi:signal transduction histidine kinase
MASAWKPPARWVFGVATALSLFSTLQAYRLSVLVSKPGMPPESITKLAFLNFVYWYAPALLVPVVVSLAHRFPVESGRRARRLGLHLLFGIGFSMVCTAAIIGARALLWDGGGKMPSLPWLSYVQRQYLTYLDWGLMTYGAIVGLSHAATYQQDSQRRKLKEAQLETRLVEARLKTLEAELHPHFLFNTLHAISTLVHRDPEAADRMISRLSDLLRLTFDRQGEGRVPLKDELEFLEKYLEIEQTRFQDRLTVRFDVDPETLDADVPHMILQPLVENAIKHGIAPRSADGLIEVRTLREGDMLRMEVRDNGPGLTGGALTALRTGVGLSNTRARLECLYGVAHRLEFTTGHGGLAVRIDIPFQRPAPEGAAASRVA